MKIKFWTLYKMDRGSEIFWTGKYTVAGFPASSADREKARMFESAREVYDFAGPRKVFQCWRAGLR